MFAFDKKELAIMEIFWREKRALTHNEILTLMDQSISRNAVYLYLNALLDKDAIQIGPSVRCGRTYGRTFSAIITKEDYIAMQMQDYVTSDEQALRRVVTMFLGSSQITLETLDALEEKIREKRKELEQ